MKYCLCIDNTVDEEIETNNKSITFRHLTEDITAETNKNYNSIDNKNNEFVDIKL